MNRLFLTVFLAATSAAMAAQVTGEMRNDDHAGKMARMDAMAADTTYTGCLQPGTETGTLLLTDAEEGTIDAMRHDGMSHVAMSHDTMNHDMTKHEVMDHETMDHGSTMLTTLVLRTKSVNLRKHLGHRVSVRGVRGASASDTMGMEQPVFTVKALKMVAKSCSPAM